jgi:uncharacterized protein (TIGR00369 family)
MNDVPAAIARHKEVLASGEHLLSGLGMRDVEVDGADLAIELDVDATLAGPRGALQGGLVATLADIVGGRMAMVGLGEGSIVVTSDMTVHYLGPVMTTAHAVGHVLRRGRRSVVTRVEVYDGRDGPLAAACQLAFTIVTPRAR